MRKMAFKRTFGIDEMVMNLIVFIFISVALFTIETESALTYECPEPVDIYPCYCEDEDDDPWIFCNHLTKPEEIYKGVKGLDGYKIYKMSFFMNWILDPIKSDAFDGLAVERILFENSTISLSAPQFKGMEDSLFSIQLRACFNKTNPLGTWSLGHLTKLREISLEKNKITSLPDDWLTSIPDSLRSVTVEENTIVTLGDEVFAKVKHLTFLVLEGNKITFLKRSMFPTPATDLRSLNLNSNRLLYLPSDLFSEMPNLRTLELANNRLNMISESTFSEIMPLLVKFDFLGNPLKCDFNLRWLYSGTKKPALLEGRCAEPEKLKNKSLFQLKLQDLQF